MKYWRRPGGNGENNGVTVTKAGDTEEGYDFEYLRPNQIGMVREIKKLTVVFNPLIGFFDLVYMDVTVKGPGFLGVREVRCPRPD